MQLRVIPLVFALVVPGCQSSSRLGIFGNGGDGQVGIGYVKPPQASDDRAALGSLDGSLARALRESYDKHAETAPVALVPSDGSELALQAIDAKITITGPIAHTELHFTFHNTEARQREGRFSITLPDGAAVDRFAMNIDGTWREARVVSRTQGRAVYETILKQRRDPALLEQDLGNRFSARVFPIAPSADKELIVGYDHAVSSARPYVLGLKGLPAIPNVAVQIDRDGDVHAATTSNVVPDDVVVPVSPGSVAVVGNGTFAVRLDAPAPARPDPLTSVLVLVDTSASRSSVMAKQAAIVQRIGEAVGDHPLVVAAFDHEIDEMYRGRGNDVTTTALLEHGALGASDLGKALDYAATTGIARVILVGDGSPTLGESDAAKLATRVTTIPRIDAIQVGDSITTTVLRPIVAAGKRPGAIVDARRAERALSQLSALVEAEQPISVAQATAVWPTTTKGIAPGDPIWVFGRRPGTGQLSFTVGDRRIVVDPKPANVERVGRTVAMAELAALTEQLATAPLPQRKQLGDRIETLALANKLVSVRTSFLVLESDADEKALLDNPATAIARDGSRTDASGKTVDMSGVRIDDSYTSNIPSGRTFGAVLGATAGESLSGATSAENQYVVEGVNSSDNRGEVVMIAGNAPMIDQGSTSTGMSITHDYYQNSAEIALPGGSAGLSRDARSLDNVYTVNDRPTGQRFNARGAHPPGANLSDFGVSRAASSPSPTPSSSPSLPEPPAEAVNHQLYTGEMQTVMSSIDKHDTSAALATASKMVLANPGDLAAIVSLGEALEARGASTLAARAYGSIMDLYPNRADLLRAAGERLDRVGNARSLAIDAYRRAIAERPDQASGYRLLAYTLYRDGKGTEALDILRDGRNHSSRPSIQGILDEDRQLIEAAMHASTAKKLPPSLRVILSWETDANDVDLHVYDSKGGHSWYGGRDLPSGGSLRDDITTGFGPEMFEVDNPTAFPYRIETNYFARGAMGVGMGTVQVIRFDGDKLTVEDRPFLLQTDHATIDLGTITR